jgi:hypothetical protein
MAKTSFSKVPAKKSATPTPAGTRQPAAGAPSRQAPPQGRTQQPAPAATRPTPTPANRPAPTPAARPTPANRTQTPAPAARKTPTPARKGPTPEELAAQQEAEQAELDLQQANAEAEEQQQEAGETSLEDEVAAGVAEGTVLSESDQIEQETYQEAGLAEIPKASIVSLVDVPIGDIQGQLTGSDFSYPKLKLGQSVGPLTEELGFSAGDIVINDATILWQDGCEAVEIVVLSALKQFVEDLPYGSDEYPRIYATIEEAEADGLITTWGDNGEKPEVLPQLLCLVMVKLPEGVDPDGFEEVVDGMYQTAVWRVAGASYKNIMKTLTNAAKTRLRDGLHTGTFKLSANKIKGKVNTFWVPVLSPGGKNSPEFIEAIVGRVGASAQ